MASRRFYAYYIRGSQLALVEHDSVSGDGLNYTGTDINDIGPSGGLQWKSPIASITDGLEIEYAYSPRYTFDAGQSRSNKTALHAWTVIDGYLTLLTSELPWDVTTAAVNGHIVVQGSDRWNGLHKVKEVQTNVNTIHGGIKTFTKVNQSVKYFTDSSANWVAAATNSITGINPANAISNIFTDSTTTPYLWIAGSDASVNNNGLFSDWGIASATALDLSTAKKYDPDGDTATPIFVDDSSQVVYIYEAFKETIGSTYVISDVNALEDESDTIDLPEYLSKALVYYVQGKLAEDQADLERKEYFMREFRRILEKHESSKIRGPRMMIPGSHGIR